MRNPHYCVRHFLEDEARLLSAGSSALPRSAAPAHAPDGRLLPLPTAPLREAIDAEGRAIDAFEHRYGAEVGAHHLKRFRLVLDFIVSHEVEIRAAGLTGGGDPPTVLEEFLDYLLNCDVAADSGRIPETALGRFLDEWGTRWI